MANAGTAGLISFEVSPDAVAEWQNHQSPEEAPAAVSFRNLAYGRTCVLGKELFGSAVEQASLQFYKRPQGGSRPEFVKLTMEYDDKVSKSHHTCALMPYMPPASDRLRNEQMIGQVLLMPKTASSLQKWARQQGSGALPRLSVTLPGEGAVGDGFSLARLRDATQCATFVVACSILQGSPTYDSRDMASMGLGVQGLADVFADLGWQYTDPPSRSLNKEIFEHMYFTALCTSSLIGLHTRKIFPGFKQSKYAGGWFHWHDWAGTDLSIPREIWSRLSERIVRDGLFNSQFIALMPTSGCAQVTGCSDAFYPFYANASTKVTNKEEALRPNRSFWRHVRLDDREALNLVGGRVSCLPEALRQRYLRFQTAFDYNQEDLIQMSRDRAPFVDQSQSHSLFLREEDALLHFLGVLLLLPGLRRCPFPRELNSQRPLQCGVAGVAGNGRRGCLWPCRTLPSRGPRRWRR